MENRTVNVTLSEPMYERVRASADALDRPIEEVLSQFIATAYPVLEDDLPLEMRTEFAGWLLFSDDQLWGLAKSRLGEAKQIDLEKLLEQQRHSSLNSVEQKRLNQLVKESQELVLYKAEAQRLLAQRGISVYPNRHAI